MKAHVIIRCMITVIILFALKSEAEGKLRLERPRFKVAMTIFGMENYPAAESFLTRELRDVKDIEIVSDNKVAGYWLYITIIKLKNKASESTGYVFDYHFFDRPSILNQLMGHSEIRTAPLPEWFYKDFTRVLQESDSWSMLSSAYQVCGLYDDTSAICSEIVAEFDAKCLEPERKMYQRLVDEGLAEFTD